MESTSALVGGPSTVQQCPQPWRQTPDHLRYTNCVGAATRCFDRATRAKLGHHSHRPAPVQSESPSMSHGRRAAAYRGFQECAAGLNHHILAAYRGRHLAAQAFGRARIVDATYRRAPRASATSPQFPHWSGARRPTAQCARALPSGVRPKTTGRSYTTRHARRWPTRLPEQHDS